MFDEKVSVILENMDSIENCVIIGSLLKKQVCPRPLICFAGIDGQSLEQFRTERYTVRPQVETRQRKVSPHFDAAAGFGVAHNTEIVRR